MGPESIPVSKADSAVTTNLPIFKF